jgi:hypothetical protein
MRNLVRTRYPEEILMKAQAGLHFDWVSDDDFVHELLIPSSSFKSRQAEGGATREQRLASTRHKRYVWLNES